MSPRSHLKIACINIERDNHLDKLQAFISTYEPDVLCLQELCQPDIPFFEDLMGAPLSYRPMATTMANKGLTEFGVGIVARKPLRHVLARYYHGSCLPGRVPRSRSEMIDGVSVQTLDTVTNVLLSANVDDYRIATTHLVVTPDGQSTPEQQAIATRLIDAAQWQADMEQGLLLAGDFNAPRGGATFDMLASAFIDGVPAHYDTSIDGEIHRAGPLPGRMVDGLFHTPNYRLEDVVLHNGVSDHCALTGTLSHAS